MIPEHPYDSRSSVCPATSARMTDTLFPVARAMFAFLASWTIPTSNRFRGRPLFVGMNRAVAPRLAMIRAGFIDRPMNSWMEFSIGAQNLSILKHGCGVVKAIARGYFGEPNDGRHSLARQRCQCRAELTTLNINGELSRVPRVIREASNHGLRAAGNFHSFEFAFDLTNDIFNRIHGATLAKTRLMRGDLHRGVAVDTPRRRAILRLAGLGIHGLFFQPPATREASSESVAPPARYIGQPGRVRLFAALRWP